MNDASRGSGGSGDPRNTIPIPPRLLVLPIPLKVILGSTRLPLEQVAHLERGTTVLLDSTLSDPVRGMVGETEVLAGEVYTQYGRFAVRVNRILATPVEAGEKEAGEEEKHEI
jgi:flagellar motor switch protein FliM